MALSRPVFGAFLAALFFAVPLAVAGQAIPKRVVSMNVCTDQLAMLIAGAGQLHSVSWLAGRPETSALADQAKDYEVNHGLAEEIFLMQPDLVIAGTYTTRTTVAMLRRLGFRVEEFAPETSFDDVRANISRMGGLLGQEGRARELVAELDRGLAAVARDTVSGKTVATWSSNSYSSGAGSLADAVIEAAGLENLGKRLGIRGAGRLPLEVLVLAAPDLVAVDDHDYAAPALAQENFVHPAFRAVASDERLVHVPARDWICGGPFTLEAVRILRDAAERTPGR